MKTFQFPLEKVLDWRHLQMRAEEDKLATLQHRLELVNRQMSALASAAMKAEASLLKLPVVSGSELQALTAFQAQVRKERTALDLERLQCEKAIAAQRLRLLKVRKEFRVIEKLKDQRKLTWTYLNNREVENAAADAHISKLVRGDQ